MSGDDDRSWNDGDKLSFSERDRLRRERRGRDEHPRGVSAAREAQAKKQYLKGLDGLFSAKGGPEAEKLAKAVRAAHGTPGLADACRALRDAVGLPGDAALLSMFLDSGDAELVAAALEAIRSACEGGELKLSGGLRSQIRMLADDPSDEVAELAERILA